jgi:hypothetical protein
VQVLTSTMTLLRSASARPQPQPGALASAMVAVVLRMPSTLEISLTLHCDPLWVWL